MACYFNDEPAAAAYAEQAQSLRERIYAYFYDVDAGLFRELQVSDAPICYSECTQALAIVLALTGVDSDSAAAGLWDRYQQRSIDDAASCIPASPFGKYHTHEALGRMGRKQEILEDIMQHWGPMLAAGSKTTWEVFETGGHQSLSKHSQCHGWAAIPVVAVLRHILHVDVRAENIDQDSETSLGIITAKRTTIHS